VNSPFSEARIASTRVLPATPLPPMPLPSIPAIRPVTNVPWPTASNTSLVRVPVSNTCVIRPWISGWVMSRPVSSTAMLRRDPPPAAARASPARTRSYAHVYLRPVRGSRVSSGSAATFILSSRST
jgi:hypothetical protein